MTKNWKSVSHLGTDYNSNTNLILINIRTTKILDNERYLGKRLVSDLILSYKRIV